MKKMLVLDMDGTFVDLYGVEGWLADLRAENPRPYVEAQPLYDMAELNELLLQLKAIGYLIAITSWLSKESSSEYKKATRIAKRNWLEQYQVPADEVHLVQYGTPKHLPTLGRADFQVLADDTPEVLAEWKKHNPIGLDANQNLLEMLRTLIELSEQTVP